MQFDANMMRTLLKKDDTALWGVIREMAAAYGIPLPSDTPPAAEMARLRAVLGTKGAADVEGAAEILRRYREGR